MNLAVILQGLQQAQLGNIPIHRNAHVRQDVPIFQQTFLDAGVQLLQTIHELTHVPGLNIHLL